MTSKDVNKEGLIADFRAVVEGTEELLSATAGQVGEKAAALRNKLTDRLVVAKTKLVAAEEMIMDSTKAAARATDEYVHENPWQSVIIAGGVGFIIGFLSRRS